MGKKEKRMFVVLTGQQLIQYSRREESKQRERERKEATKFQTFKIKFASLSFPFF